MNAADGGGRVMDVDAGHASAGGVTSTVGLPPRAAHHVARPRLDALVAPPEGPNITLVIAQTGWGKTVAVRDWVERAGSRVAWLTFDRSDDHPMRFWYDVLSAVDAALPGVARRAIDALTESGASDDAFVGALVTDVARARRRLVLVLDDLHVVHDRRVLRSLEQLLEHAPPLLRFVLITRQHPPLPLARWRARGLVGEVSESALAFRRDEAAALLASFEGVELADEDLATLVDEAEGWVAGLQLAALASSGTHRRGPEHADADASTGREAVADLLVREVLSLQSTAVREFLGDTCVVERFDVELCRALTGRDDTQEMLRTIEDRRLFLVPLDAHRRSFRYHQFFRDFLCNDLEARDPDRLRRLHAVAAAWFRDEGDVRLAVSHLLDAGDTDGAFTLAIEEAPRGRSTRSGQSDWLDLLPPDYVGAEPQRIARLVVALVMQSSFTDARIWLERAQAVVEDGAAPGLERRLAAMRAQLAALRGDAARAVELGAPMLPIDEREWDDVVFERLPVNLARSYLILGQLPDAKAMVDLLRERDRLSDVASLVVLPAIRANVAAADDRLRDAEALARDALRHAPSAPAGHFGVLDAQLALVRVLLERDERPAAEAALTELEARAADLDSVMHLTHAELAHAELAWRRDDLEDVAWRLGRARSYGARSEGTALARRADALEARIRVRTGDLQRAAVLIATLPPSVERELLQARAELAADPASARARLDATRPEGTRDRIVRELLLARAARGEADSAGHLERAVRLAEPERYASVFWEERAPSVTIRPAPPAPAALSERELVVLRHLGGAGNSAQIASELFISRNTLKSHVKAIYRKLGVGSREEAVASARRLGLL
jgi:LuxR family maltose regulon positive regulatory protein